MKKIVQIESLLYFLKITKQMEYFFKKEGKILDYVFRY